VFGTSTGTSTAPRTATDARSPGLLPRCRSLAS